MIKRVRLRKRHSRSDGYTIGSETHLFRLESEKRTWQYKVVAEINQPLKWTAYLITVLYCSKVTVVTLITLCIMARMIPRAGIRAVPHSAAF